MLAELEDRGLVGWEKRTNSYDLHPIVRGVIWSGLDDGAKQRIYEVLQSYFESVPLVDWRMVNNSDDLDPVIVRYNMLCELGRYDDAIALFSDRLKDVFYYRLSGNRQIMELLERLFDKERGFNPLLTKKRDRAFALNRLAVAYKDSGKAAEAVRLIQSSNELYEQEGGGEPLISGLGFLAEIMERCGRLYESEAAARRGLRECESTGVSSERPYLLVRLGMTLEVRGRSAEAAEVLLVGERCAEEAEDSHALGFTKIRSAENLLRTADARDVWPRVESTWKFLQSISCERCLNALEHLRGLVALKLGDSKNAEKLLTHAFTRARETHFIVHEIEARVRLSALRLRQGALIDARELLDDVFETAARSPYPLVLADAFNLLAQIERVAGNHAAAAEEAAQAYRWAWCDGPPFAYHWGLTAAQKHLRELDAPEPQMPPFDAARFEPPPEVDINLEDEQTAAQKH